VKNIKRIAALAGVVLLAGMYILTLVFALSNRPDASSMLMASIYATVIIPVLLYAFMLVYKWQHPKDESPEPKRARKEYGENYQIDTIIFDIGKVLVNYGWLDVLQNLGYDEETIDAVAQAVFLNEDWIEGDRGILNEDELLQAFIDNNPAYEPQIRETFRHLGETVHTYGYTERWLDSLKNKGYRLYILSNFSEPLYNQAKEKLSFLSKVDGGYMSYQIKLLKPDPAIYQRLIKDFHIIPEHAVFLDDLLDNVAEARAQGLNAIHFTSRREAVAQLREFGVR
jgi:putative hydrolase of the HAD superfamily